MRLDVLFCVRLRLICLALIPYLKFLENYIQIRKICIEMDVRRKDKMARKKIIAGNWKMNNTPSETKEFMTQLKAIMPKGRWCDVALCVPAVDIPAAVRAVRETRIGIGAENCNANASGAYTGEIATNMLVDAGCKYVIIGHSERRQYFGETDATVNQRVLAAVKAGLTPIICVGEKKEEREAGYTNALVTYQTQIALSGLTADEVKHVVIAYEPVWAIGTGKTATADQAQEIHAFIRKTIADKYGKEVAENTSILYGGSCKPSNAAELFAKPDVDGGLIGGAALKADSFMGIITAF